LTKLKKRKN